ncbi:MAG TPA: two-component regulator propeller domain-containing protein [Flavobacteriales bacterium]|nr:two-component regulator propeller domain-containing protein [Flavobacteriales bacterium]
MTGTFAQAQSWEVFDTLTAGFPTNSVTDIAIDSQDRVWVATNWGLCKYDGGNWEVFQVGSSGLTDNVIQCLAVDTLDRVWIGTLLHGIVIYDGATWTTFDTQNSGLPDDQIKCITIDHRNWAWVGTYLGLSCYTGTEWRQYNNTPDSYNNLVMNGPVVNDVAVREDGLVAIGTLNGGFHYLTDTSITVHATYIDNFPDNTQVGVGFDPVNDQRWLACPAHGLLRHFAEWESGLWFEYSTISSNIPTNSMTCLSVAADGRPWVGTTYAGIAVRDTDGEFTNYTSSNSGLPDNTISSLAFTSDGTLWVGTYYGGAARFNPEQGTDEEPRAGGLLLFPNPATGKVWLLNRANAAPTEWRILDAGGRAVISGTVSAGIADVIDLTAVPPGIYLVEINSGLSKSLGKLVVQ